MAPLPPLNALRAFDAAGRHLNFRLAADELGVTQAAVAQHVRNLEARLGVALFQRLARGVTLSPEGRRYHLRIAEAFEQMREATRQVRPEPTSVVISATPTFAAKWLIPHLPRFAERFPETDLRIMATEQISSLHSDGIDLAIRQAEPPFRASLEAWRLFENEIVAVG